MTSTNNPLSLSLYLHIPFCSLKCAYCDFNSYAGIEELVRPYCEALIEEIRLWGRVAGRRPVPTVFFGGGTPSLLPLGDVERIMDALRTSFAVEPDAEVSLEANPGSLREPEGERMPDYLRGLLACGVNRLSFGVQSFHDDELAALDRIHSAAEAKESYRWAREAGFRRINLDLIYGLPSFDSLRAAQDARGMERWQSTLDQAIELAPEHLSLYALTVEEGTKLAYDVGHGRVPAPDPDLQAAMYEWTLERLAATPYRQYEISNWALQGEECRHNLVYWRNGEWLGLGAGAHSHLKEDGRWKVEDGLAFRFADVQLEEEGRWKPALSRVEGSRVEGMEDGLAFRFADAYSPRRYIEAVRETAEEGIDPGAPLGDLLRAMRQVTFVDPQPPALQMADTAILALRLNEGLDTRDFERRFGEPPERVFGPALTGALSLGLLEAENGRLRLTPRGRLLANEVFVRLLPDQG